MHWTTVSKFRVIFARAWGARVRLVDVGEGKFAQGFATIAGPRNKEI